VCAATCTHGAPPRLPGKTAAPQCPGRAEEPVMSGGAAAQRAASSMAKLLMVMDTALL